MNTAHTLAAGTPLASFKSRLDARHGYWWGNPSTPSEVKAVASLVSSKMAMRRYISGMGLRLPRLYFDAASIDDIDFGALPERVVIKPHNGWDSDAVMLISGERELLSGATVQRAHLRQFCRATLAKARFAKSDVRIMVEEFVRDYDPRFDIPRDFKVYVAGGRAHLIQVIDRNPAKTERNHSFYTRNWLRIADRFQTAYKVGPTVPRPRYLRRLLAWADFVASDIQAFLRLDFYMTSDGPVFGEFTSHPFAGIYFTPCGDRYLSDLMARFPDDIPSGWTIERPWLRRMLLRARVALAQPIRQFAPSE